MADQKKNGKAVFRVIDAMEAPHGGRFLRLRLAQGEIPSLKSLRGARLLASSPDGSQERWVRIRSFVLFGGKPSDNRLSRTGRIDVHVQEEEGSGVSVGLQWTVRDPQG